MKWLKGSAAILFLIAALGFAYTRFETSFNPRRGQGKGGPPPMSAMAKRAMAMRPRNTKGAAKNGTHKKKPGSKEVPPASSSTGEPKIQQAKTGGD